ncbi:MAG: 30S ribosomal protein S12 methylthiotransferase RimO [Oscillospiraceae bacterium]
MAGIYFISLGCDKNRIDAEIMANALIEAGHFVTGNLESADCAVINTCGFIESAKKEAIDNIFDMVRAKQRGDIKAIVITGCLAERYRDELCELVPEADAVIGLAANKDIVMAVESALKSRKFTRYGPPECLEISGERALSTPQHYAYIKIAEGCSNHCTYCAIPSIRGHYRSRMPSEIVAEARALAERGVRELIVIAQDTTSYGVDLSSGETLPSLLRELCSIDDLWRIRVLYAYPERITNELIATMASEEKIAKYLDIPLQHANPNVLRRMGRQGDGKTYLELIDKLRAAMPDITLRSSFIVGFPGESDAEFEELLEFLSRAHIDRAGCFAFSCEEGTPAEKLALQIEDDIKQLRVERFESAQSAILSRALDSKVDTVFEVICDGFDEECGMFACRGDADAPEIDTCVYLPAESDLMPGEIYSVVITAADGQDLLARLAL